MGIEPYLGRCAFPIVDAHSQLQKWHSLHAHWLQVTSLYLGKVTSQYVSRRPDIPVKPCYEHYDMQTPTLSGPVWSAECRSRPSGPPERSPRWLGVEGRQVVGRSLHKARTLRQTCRFLSQSHRRSRDPCPKVWLPCRAACTPTRPSWSP